MRVATGITSKIDEQLKLSQAVDKASAKVNELKSSVTNKVWHARAAAWRQHPVSFPLLRRRRRRLLPGYRPIFSPQPALHRAGRRPEVEGHRVDLLRGFDFCVAAERHIMYCMAPLSSAVQLPLVVVDNCKTLKFSKLFCIEKQTGTGAEAPEAE